MYLPVRISTEAPYLLIDLSLLPPCPLKLFPLSLLIRPSVNWDNERLERVQHISWSHIVSPTPHYIKSETPAYTKTPELRKSDQTWCSRKSIRVKRVLTLPYNTKGLKTIPYSTQKTQSGPLLRVAHYLTRYSMAWIYSESCQGGSEEDEIEDTRW